MVVLKRIADLRDVWLINDSTLIEVEVLQGRDNHSPVKIFLNTMPLDVTQWGISPVSS